ncbi:hypothetical protein OUZ56_008126 [Daphnia magna]|uniref:Uncharacterized protein n=1 Tax=Daphnia magna TaxID=35525 RepID=A0ABR0AC18_9CRUS|nr:hypothetical protein OUZ56_008126 [Daphnia magna]
MSANSTMFDAKIKELPLDVVAQDEESPTDERPLSSPIAPAILFFFFFYQVHGRENSLSSSEHAICSIFARMH